MKTSQPLERRRLLKALAAARQRTGLTREELADRVGGDRSFIARYESGARGAPKQKARPRVTI
jgi:transcriptional regulator with XRE-family HTH domain